MKTLLLSLFVSLSASAIELKFIGPCQEEFIMRTEVTEEFDNVGELTIATLAKFKIPFQGTAQGLNSAFETPTGNAAMEIISNTEMRAYGWCYSVDGFSPEVFPHEIPITPDTKSITWTFGFAHMKGGQWIAQCTPAWTVKPASMCIDPTVGPAPSPEQ